MSNDNLKGNETTQLDKTGLERPFRGVKEFYHVLANIITNPFTETVEGYEFTLKDIKILLRKEWLNDKIVNAYFSLLEKHNNEVLAFSTYFYYFLAKDGYEKVSKWTKKTNIFDYKLILIPIHLTNHWVFVAVDTRNCSIEYYDSLGGYNVEVVKRISDYIEKEQSLKIRYQKSYFRYKKNAPLQTNGYDCGVFICMYARFRLERSSCFYTGPMKHFRLKILHEILFKGILYDLDHKYSSIEA